MNKKMRWILVSALVATTGLMFWSFTPGTKGQKGAGTGPNFYTRGFENYDLRDPHEKVADVFDSYRVKLTSKQQNRIASASNARQEAEAGLVTRFPGLVVERGLFGFPEAVGINSADRFLTLPSSRENETIVRDFVAANAGVYGLTAGQARQLITTADYANPAGNLSWVELEQRINDIPVFGGSLRACLTKDGEMARTTGQPAPGLDYQSLTATPTLSPAEAAAAAARTINYQIDATALNTESIDDNGRTQILARGPFTENIKTQLVYFPLESGVATLAYSMTLWERVNAYYILVDAETGRLLWRKNITSEQTQNATYSIYDNDSPAPLSPTNATPGSGIQGAPISRTSLTLISELPAFDNLGWITDGGNVTTGNNVDAGLDIDGTNGIDAAGRATGSPNRVFDFPYDPAVTAPSDANFRMGAVTNLFFWTNRYHDIVYTYGFTEAARNFQTNNFGRGGVGNDFVRAEVQDSGGTNNANFATPADGQLPRMQMYIFPGPTPDRDGDLDAEIFVHEMTHGLSNRLHNNGAGLTTAQAGGMGEGWSDFYGRMILSTAGEDVNGLYASGAYATLQLGSLGTNNSYYGIRRFPYGVKTNVGANGKPHYPLTFADIDPTKVNTTDGAFPESPLNFTVNNGASEVHNIGEIWCMMLLEVRARIINRLGWAAGNARMLQITTDAMKLDVASPTLIQARDTIIAADNAGFGGADVNDIWAGFATRGNGFGSSVTGTATVTESFLTPNLAIATPPGVTFSDAGGNNNGFADPGEPLTLTVPLINPLATTAVGATATIGGVTVGYGDIAGSATVSRTFAYTVPVATSCGSQVVIPIDINSSLGVVSPAPTYTLNVGQPVIGFTQNFDGVVAPALPAGWTTAVTGSGVAFVGSTTNPSSAPNDAFAPDVTTTGTSALVSPSIPISSASAQLSFKNLYNTESTFDGMVLEISNPAVSGGAFQDIVTAGGSFVSGGYNAGIVQSGTCTDPLNGRQAWTGLSGGSAAAPTYKDSVVNLPASANGQSITLRWLVGHDCSIVPSTNPGVRVDSITIQTGVTCAAVGVTVSGTITRPNTSPVGGVVVRMTGSQTRATITDASGNYHFDSVPTGVSYTLTPSLANFTFSPINRVLTPSGNVTDATFTANADAGQTANAIDTNEFFVRQHYLDFLGREPDQGGLDYWSGQINQCGANTGCIFGKRIDVSAAFFISGEFQETGSFVYNMYAALLGRTLSFSEFSTDRAAVVGGGGLDAAKTAFAQAYVARAEFTTKYPLSMTRDQFVDAVIQTMHDRSGGTYTGLRTGFQTDYDNSGRYLVARHAAEASAFVAAEYNKAFVLMQYYGYLRRGIDQNGYDFWLNVLNNNPTNFRGMVCSFLTSAEYQNRFSTVVTHNNNECNGVQ